MEIDNPPSPPFRKGGMGDLKAILQNSNFGANFSPIVTPAIDRHCKRFPQANCLVLEGDNF
jgi:hypothetical protein